MAVRFERQDGIGHIVLDRPPANSYDRAFIDELDAAIEDARKDDDVKAVVVRSASEKFFSAGADVSLFAKSDLDAQSAFVVSANGAMSKFESMPKVVIAAINGHCLGGGLEIALCCDFRIAAEGGYKIGLPEVTLGLLPGTGGTQRLPRLIGRQKALELMLTGRTLSPQEAKDAGVVDLVVPAAELQARAVELARSYADGPSFAKGQIKLAAVQGLGAPLAEGLAIEHQALIRLFKSEDAREGVTAFVEKRKPDYKGR
ncbi:MAG TPA: enoyl-CoA hydratase/isomerase family protein [Candidatus Limnocylindria bacterium]|nr:enoyl-CoA hydratase/isomerase family protein [Candidatus Limnocylindria bacterium]